MIKYAKIIDQQTKEVQVGAGCTDEYYESIGMTKMGVELAYNGRYYVEGFTPIEPEPTPEEKKQRRIAELKSKLRETDYIYNVIQEGDATIDYYAEVIANRKAWRKEVRELGG